MMSINSKFAHLVIIYSCELMMLWCTSIMFLVKIVNWKNVFKEEEPLEEIDDKHYKVCIFNPIVLIRVVIFSSVSYELQSVTNLEQNHCNHAQAYAWNDNSWLLVIFKKLHIERNNESKHVKEQLPIEELSGKFKLNINDIPWSNMLLNIERVLLVKFKHHIC